MITTPSIAKALATKARKGRRDIAPAAKAGHELPHNDTLFG